MGFSVWTDMLLYGDQGGGSQPLLLLFTLLMAFGIGQMIGLLYLGTNTEPDHSKSFVNALVVLPMIVALLMMLMVGSFMVAFGLLAVFAVVRFRNVLRDTRDTVFILWSIVEGMATGTQRFSTAILGAMAVCAVIVYLRLINFAARRQPDGSLSVEIDGDAPAGRAAIRALLHRHANRWNIVSDQLTPGQGRVITYELFLRDQQRVNDLRDELADSQLLHEVSYVPHKRSTRDPY